MALYKREYKDYKSYIKHQGKKLTKNFKSCRESSPRRIQNFMKEFIDISPIIPGKEILCLGARLGEEVIAFRRLGYLGAVGIDVNPGPDNKYVIKGDFHNLPFDNAEFDAVFCNCLDHAWDLGKVSGEAARVLKSKGILILDISFVGVGKKLGRGLVRRKRGYESIIWDSVEDVINQFSEFDKIRDQIHCKFCLIPPHRTVVILRKRKDIG